MSESRSRGRDRSRVAVAVTVAVTVALAAAVAEAVAMATVFLVRETVKTNRGLELGLSDLSSIEKKQRTKTRFSFGV